MLTPLPAVRIPSTTLCLGQSVAALSGADRGRDGRSRARPLVNRISLSLRLSWMALGIELPSLHDALLRRRFIE